MESDKLDLMSDVAELRLRLQAVENEKSEYREKYESLQVGLNLPAVVCFILHVASWPNTLVNRNRVFSICSSC